jgi:hypothetical protein
MRFSPVPRVAILQVSSVEAAQCTPGRMIFIAKWPRFSRAEHPTRTRQSARPNRHTLVQANGPTSSIEHSRHVLVPFTHHLPDFPKAINIGRLGAVGESKLALDAFKASSGHVVVEIVGAWVGAFMVGLPEAFLREAGANSCHQQNKAKEANEFPQTNGLQLLIYHCLLGFGKADVPEPLVGEQPPEHIIFAGFLGVPIVSEGGRMILNTTCSAGI